MSLLVSPSPACITSLFFSPGLPLAYRPLPWLVYGLPLTSIPYDPTESSMFYPVFPLIPSILKFIGILSLSMSLSSLMSQSESLSAMFLMKLPLFSTYANESAEG